MFDPQGRKMRRMQLDRIRYTNTELKWKENVKNIGTGDLRHSERHLTIFDEISKLAEVILTDGDLNKIDKMYQIRFINFEGESWVVDSNRKLYIAHEIRKLFGLDFTCVDVSDIIETADNVDYAGSIIADIQNMQVQQENGTIFLPRFRPHIIYNNATEKLIARKKMRQLREHYRPKKSRFFPRWASVDTLWMLFPLYVIFMVVLLLSMYLVYIITQDEMKKYLVLEKNEIVNISKSEPHVESYVNDDL